jgi:hypothetical protein
MNLHNLKLCKNFMIGSLSFDYLKHYSVLVNEMSVRLKR